MSVTTVFERPVVPNQTGITGPVVLNLEVEPRPVAGMTNMYEGWNINIIGATRADNRAICEVLLRDPPETTALENLREKLGDAIVADQQRLSPALQIDDAQIPVAAEIITQPGG